MPAFADMPTSWSGYPYSILKKFSRFSGEHGACAENDEVVGKPIDWNPVIEMIS